MNTPNLKAVREIIGADVPDDLLALALTHPSTVGEGERTLKSNQRLEFLGDAILGACIAAHLYETQSTLPEGELTLRKIALVQKPTLARAAKQIGLGAHLILGRGEEAAGGREREAILADALEAVLGTIFLTHGFDGAREFVMRAMLHEIENLENTTVIANIKNILQEYTQANGLGTPNYHTTESSGPAHARRFTSEVLLNGVVRGQGEGASKKDAEFAAARMALGAMQD